MIFWSVMKLFIFQSSLKIQKNMQEESKALANEVSRKATSYQQPGLNGSAHCSFYLSPTSF